MDQVIVLLLRHDRKHKLLFVKICYTANTSTTNRYNKEFPPEPKNPRIGFSYIFELNLQVVIQIQTKQEEKRLPR